MDKYFPTGILFPLSIFVPFFKVSSIFKAYQTDSIQILNTENNSMCHKLNILKFGILQKNSNNKKKELSDDELQIYWIIEKWISKNQTIL